VNSCLISSLKLARKKSGIRKIRGLIGFMLIAKEELEVVELAV
jgi:hypothetical protein